MSDRVGIARTATCQDLEERCFLQDAYQELKRAESEHAPINSLHEGYSVILEELDEFWVEVKKRAENRSARNTYMELVQVAAMAARTAKNVMGVPSGVWA